MLHSCTNNEHPSSVFGGRNDVLWKAFTHAAIFYIRFFRPSGMSRARVGSEHYGNQGGKDDRAQGLLPFWLLTATLEHPNRSRKSYRRPRMTASKPMRTPISPVMLASHKRKISPRSFCAV
jgi:hypothetical protein